MPAVLVYTPRVLARSQTFVVDQVRALRRWTPSLVGRERVPDGLDVGDLWPAGIAFPSRRGRLERLHRRIGTLRAAARQLQPELIHAHFLTGGIDVVRTLGVGSTPIVVTAHGFDASWHASWPRTHNPAQLLYGRLRTQLLSSPVRFIAVSSYIRDRLLDLGAAPEAVVVHHTGVDTAYFTSKEPPPPSRILFVGRLVPQKGVDDLLTAVRLLQGRRVDAHLTVVGDGPDGDRLRRRAKVERLDVTFRGMLDRAGVRDELERTTILCAPSVTTAAGDREGLGMVVLEAQAMGRPVVATRSGGIPEAIDPGVTGDLVPERDPAGLASAIEKCLEDAALVRTMGSAAAEMVRRSFDLETQTWRLEQLYDEWCGTLPESPGTISP